MTAIWSHLMRQSQRLQLQTLLNQGPSLYIKSAANKSTQIDAIESFTTELVERKSLKWEIYRNKQQERQQQKRQHFLTNVHSISNKFTKTTLHLIENIKSTPKLDFSLINFTNLKQDQIDQLILNIIAENRNDLLNEFLKECFQNHRLPSNGIVREIFEILCKSTDLISVKKLANYCNNLRPNFHQTFDGFQVYIGWCIWNQSNYTPALDCLKKTYINADLELKESIQFVIDKIVNETVKYKCEAVVVAVTKVAQELLVLHNDLFMLKSLWNCCFFSTWFSDQQLANKLFDESIELRKDIGERAGFLCYIMLQNHNVDGLYRLVESFLRFDMKRNCRTCLELLFEYQYWRTDLRACSEIMRTSLDLGIPISEMYTQKLLNLLLVNRGKSVKLSETKTKPSKFELKF